MWQKLAVRQTQEQIGEEIRAVVKTLALEGFSDDESESDFSDEECEEFSKLV